MSIIVVSKRYYNYKCNYEGVGIMVYAVYQEPKHKKHTGTVVATTLLGTGAGSYFGVKNFLKKLDNDDKKINDEFLKTAKSIEDIAKKEGFTLYPEEYIRIEKAEEALKNGKITKEEHDYIKTIYDCLKKKRLADRQREKGIISEEARRKVIDETNAIKKEAEKQIEFGKEAIEKKFIGLGIYDVEKALKARNTFLKMVKQVLKFGGKNIGKETAFGAAAGLAIGLIINSLRNNN